MPGWETPYGTVSRPRGGRGDTAYQDYWRQRMGYQRPIAPPVYAPPGMGVPPEMRALTPGEWQPAEYGWLPPSGVLAAPPPEAGMFAPSWQAPTTPSAYAAPTTGAAAAPVGPWSPGMMTPAAGGTYPGMRPPALGAYPAGLGTPHPTPATAPSDAYLPLRMKGPWPSGASTQTAPTGGGGGGAPAGTPTTTGAFGPFGSIEDWRNQFYQEHGRWPTDTDAQDAIASFGFLGQTGRPPTQQEWEDRWYGGYGGTTQWGPMGGGYGYGGGGWAPPPEPSWWGGNVWGDEGWAYLPTGPGKYPYPKPERVEGAADWYNIKDIKTFQQVDPQWRDWLQQAMQSQQQHWEDPLMAPIQWMQPAQSEL